jgi:hypothetical protein
VDGWRAEDSSAADKDKTPRVATITIGGQVFTLTQTK